MLRQFSLIIFVSAVIVNFAAVSTVASANNLSVLNGRCANPGTPREALRKAAAVFLAKIVKVNDSGEETTLELRVERFWKGEKPLMRKVIVNKGGRFAPNFAAGERYFIYAYKNENGKLAFGRCSRTKLAEYADDDLKALGKGRKP